MPADLTLGPVLFNWQADEWRDFYFRMADESCVDTVYIGEIICAKRAPLFEFYVAPVVDRLQAAGKAVVFSTLAEVMVKNERKLTEANCAGDEIPVEANDASALYHLRGRAHRVGPYVNTYNEDTLSFLAAKGAHHFTLPPELPAASIAALAAEAGKLDVTLEVPVYGRLSLALSARCYHARAHGRVKDNCQYVCDKDPDGMELETLKGDPFLVINGIQTLSYPCLNLAHELTAMQEMGIRAFRISPHSGDMARAAELFRGVLDGRLDPAEATTGLAQAGFQSQSAPQATPIPFCNGFYHGHPGHEWVAPD